MATIPKPMLATEAPKDIRFPVLASAKLDGIRGIVLDGKLWSRSGKEIPNLFVQKYFAIHPELNGLDGELIVGNPNDKDVYRKTNSAVMSIKGEPEFSYFVFDIVLPSLTTQRYSVRQSHIAKMNLPCRVQILQQKQINTKEELVEFEEQVLALGYEGLIVRVGDAPYKHGRSTASEGYLLKVRRFKDAEAVILGGVEELSNQNVATKDAFGHTERSSHKENMVAKGTLGSFIVKDLKTGITFNVGTGFDMTEREQFWKNLESLKGKIIKYRYFEVGVKDLPRFPVFVGFRDRIDL